MKCHDIEVLAELFTDSELEASKAREFQEHLEGCSLCRQRLRQREALDVAIRQRLLRGGRTARMWERVEAGVTAGDAAPAGTGGWRDYLGDLLWPGPRYYAVLAGVWVLLLVFQMQRDGPERTGPGLAAEPERAAVVWLERSEALRAMLDAHDPAAPPAREGWVLPPRSEVRVPTSAV